MNPETNQTPDSQERESPYEINPSDVVFVSRNLKNADGTPQLDDEGNQVKKLEDGWEVVTLNGINPTNGREGIMLRNTNDPDELKFYSERQVRDIQRRAEEDIMSRARSAAVDLVGNQLEVKAETPDAASERHEVLVNEVGQDMGREATEEVVEVSDEPVNQGEEMKPQVAPEQLSESDQQSFVKAALFEFQRRESYSADELQNGLSRAARTYEESVGGTRGAMNAFSSLETMQSEITRAVNDYEDSMRQMEGRPNPDYDPRVVLYRRIEQQIDTLHHAKRAVGRVTEQDLADIRRASQALEGTLHEVSHEVDKDESHVASYLTELQQTQGVDVPDAPKSNKLRDFLGKVDLPLAAIKEKTATLETLATDMDGNLLRILRELDAFATGIQHGMVDQDALSRIQRGLMEVSGDDKTDEFTMHVNALNAAIEDLPKHVPELPVR